MASSYLSLDGSTRVWYWEHLPADYAGGTKTYPLLVFFHGGGENGPGDGSALKRVLEHGPARLAEDGHDMCFDTPGGRECFIVVSPQNGRFSSWHPADTAGMVEHALATYRVDPQRIYVTGLSLGGGATWELAAAPVAGALPDTRWGARLAAVAPVCGAADPARFNTGICQGIAATSLPVWAFHGALDPVVTPQASRVFVDKVNGVTSAHGYQCPHVPTPRAQLTMYPDVGHDAWDRAYALDERVDGDRNLYQWLLSHRRVTP